MSRIKNLQLHLGEKLAKELDVRLIDMPEDINNDATMVRRVHLNLLAPGSLDHQCPAVPFMTIARGEREGAKSINRMFYQRNRDLEFDRRARSIGWIRKHQVGEQKLAYCQILYWDINRKGHGIHMGEK